MAQPMRVCDREAIKNRIVNEWKTVTENRFKDEFEGSENESWLNDKIEELKNVASEMRELDLDFEAIKEGITNHCNHINETLSLGTSDVYYNNRIEGTSVVFSSPFRYNSDITYSIRTNVDYTLKNKIMDELAIATIGGDFDVKELIKDLTDRFVNQNRT